MEHFYMRRMIEKNYFRIKIIFFTLIVDTFVREVLVIGDTTLTDYFLIDRAMNFLLFFGMLFVIVIFDLKHSPILFKRVLFFILIARLFSRVFEYFHYYYYEHEMRTAQLAFEVVFNIEIEGLILIISGMFYFKESLIIGVLNLVLAIPLVLIELGDEAYHCINMILLMTVSNLVDQNYHSVCELTNFRNLTKIERRSLHLA